MRGCAGAMMRKQLISLLETLLIDQMKDQRRDYADSNCNRSLSEKALQDGKYYSVIVFVCNIL